MAISLELIKINSYFFSSFSCINMACLKMHKLNCCCKIKILAAATYFALLFFASAFFIFSSCLTLCSSIVLPASHAILQVWLCFWWVSLILCCSYIRTSESFVFFLQVINSLCWRKLMPCSCLRKPRNGRMEKHAHDAEFSLEWCNAR